MQTINQKRILAACQAVKTVECSDLIPSTNLYARERLMQEELDISLFTAEAQSAGRGRLGRSFLSPRGVGIYMTLTLPLARLSSPEMLTVTAGVALCRVLEHAFPTLSPTIKWVNDIYARDKKLAGILVEGVFSGKGNPYALIGIGINCADGSLPEELSHIATDIATVTGEAVDRTELICQVTNAILSELRRDFSEVVSDYRARSYLLGKQILVHPHGGTPYPAIARDIDAQGGLIVRLPNGEEQVLSSADVSVKRNG